MTRSHLIGKVLLLGLLACGRSEDGARETSASIHVVRDSAGVVLVDATNAAPVLLDVRDSADLRIGVVAGEERHQLFQVRGVRSTRDGAILILNGGTHEIRRYSADGEWLASYGRRGSGPGEFQFPVSMTSLPSDSSVLVDMLFRGYHLVDPDGKVVATRGLGSSLAGFVGFLDSTNAVVAAPRLPSGQYDQVVTAELIVATVNLVTAAWDTLQVLPSVQQYLYTRGELVRMVPLPFTSRPAVGVRDGEIYLATGTAPEVRVYDRHGRLKRLIRLPIPAVAIGSREWDAETSRLLARSQGIKEGEARLAHDEVKRHREVYQSVQRPDTKPFIDWIYLGDPDRIWARESPIPGELQRWFGLDPTLGTVTIVHVPYRIFVWEITPEQVLGYERDSMDVEYIVRHSTVKRP